MTFDLDAHEDDLRHREQDLLGRLQVAVHAGASAQELSAHWCASATQRRRA